MKPPNARLWFGSNVDRSGGCWVWTGPTMGRGYGSLSFKTAKGWVTEGVHRISWELANGPIPKGLCVLHHCDNRLCVNPNHLFLGTIADNDRDRDAKGRQARAEKHGQAKLTKEAVSTIRELYQAGASQNALGRKFGVARSTIAAIVRYTNWRTQVSDLC